jgi:hypothetical protein
MAHPPLPAAAGRLTPTTYQNHAGDHAAILELARVLGDPPCVVMQNLCVHEGRLMWTPRYAVARVNRSGVLRGRLRWTVTPPEAPLAVTAHAVFADTGEAVSCTADLATAVEEGHIGDGSTPAAAMEHLHWLAAARLVALHAPDILLALPPDESGTTAPPPPEAPPAPQERVVYDEHGEADPRRPTDAARLLARVAHHAARADAPGRVLELNALTLTAAAAELDDGGARVAALWRRVARRSETGAEDNG